MKKIEINSIELIGFNFYKISLINIYKNYSEHLANFIKYILFSLVKGFGITELKIFGVNSEFDNIFGVKEDVVNLIFNLKGVIFKLIKKKKLIINLYKFDKCVIKASDLCINNKWLKIINPNHIIANLSEKAILAITIKLEKGIGYNFINDNNYKVKKNIDNSILLDVNFCPINKVYYKTESLNSKFNKIIFFIQTNGAVSSLMALKKSINTLLKQFAEFPMKKNKKNIYFNLNKNYFINVFKLKLNNYMFFYFRKLNINYLGDLIQYSRNDLIKLVSCKIFHKIIKKYLLKYNLFLNTYIENWIFILNNFLKKNHETFEKKI